MDFTNEQVSDLFNSLTDNAAVAVFSPAHEIVYVSAQFAQALGYREDELLGMKHSDLCFAEFVNSPAYHMFWQKLLRGQSFQDKIVLQAKNGAEVILEAKYFPIRDQQGKITGIGKICFNKTDANQEQSTVLQENFAKLAELSEQLGDLSGNGKEKLGELAQVMQTVSASSAQNITSTETLKQRTSEIESITATVHEIAYQTNMLAVNAALESTRAGSEGQGFSVVAQEMRKLAAQVDDASRNIQQMVGAIVTEVQNIMDSSKKTGNSLLSAKTVLTENQQSFDELREHATLLTTTVGDLSQLFKVQKATKID